MSESPRETIPPRRRGTLWAKLALSLCTLVLLFGIAEVTLRVIGAKPRAPTVPKLLFETDPEVGWIGRPNVAIWFTTSSFDVLVANGEDGFRCCGLTSTIESDANRESDTNRPQKVTWCVGDSFTWGWGVADDKTWVALLNQMSTDGRTYRNLGSPAYSALQEYLLIKDRFARGQQPDQVLLMYTSNDPEDNIHPEAPAPHYDVSDGTPKLRNYPAAPTWGHSPGTWGKRHSLVYNYLTFYVTRAKINMKEQFGRSPSNDHGDNAHGDTAQPNNLDQYDAIRNSLLRDIYAKLKELCAQHDVDLVVVAHEDDRRIRQVCDELALPLVDLTGYFKAYAADPSKVNSIKLRNDAHWSEVGNRIAAEGLYRELDQMQIARRISAESQVR
jgi:lysophospholipase L1-like esterase